jgi:hypothetical protein
MKACNDAKNNKKKAYFKYDKLFIDDIEYISQSQTHGQVYGLYESSIKLLSWNIERLTKAKRSCSDFITSISTYNIICFLFF